MDLLMGRSDHLEQLIPEFSSLTTFHLSRVSSCCCYVFWNRSRNILGFLTLQHADRVWHDHLIGWSTILGHLDAFWTIQTRHRLLTYSGSGLLGCCKWLSLHWLRQIRIIYQFLGTNSCRLSQIELFLIIGDGRLLWSHACHNLRLRVMKLRFSRELGIGGSLLLRSRKLLSWTSVV